MSKISSNLIRQELSELKQLLDYWRSVTGAFTAILVVLPLGGIFAEPLLPGILRITAPALAITLCVLVILFLFFLFRTRNRPQIESSAKRLFSVALLLLAIFFFSWFTWVIQVDGRWHVEGLGLTDEASRAVASGRISPDAHSLLDRFGHASEERIWRYRNVVETILSFSFAGFFALAAGSFFLFTLRLVVARSNISPTSGNS
jgi:hypothetical protein